MDQSLAFARLKTLVQERATLPKLSDTILAEIRAINFTTQLSGGRKDIPYLFMLNGLENCKWKKLVNEHLTARAIWAITIGAGIGGPNSDYTDSYLFGAFHAWPIYKTPGEALPIKDLIRTLVYGVQALGRSTGSSAKFNMVEFLRTVRNYERYASIIALICAEQSNNIEAETTRIREMFGANVAFEADRTVLSRYADLQDYCVTGALFSNITIDLTSEEYREGMELVHPGRVVDCLLTVAWTLLGREVTVYEPGVLCCAFPVLTTGTNARTDRLQSLTQRITRELQLIGGVALNDRSVNYVWDGMSTLIKEENAARIAAYKAKRVGDLLGSVWIGVYAGRMQFHGLTSVVLIAAATVRFPQAGWTNFFRLHQNEYTAEGLKILGDRLDEYVGFIERVLEITALPFTIRDYIEASREEKINFIICAYKTIRPLENITEWLAQGDIVFDLMTRAIQDPYMMYRGVPGRSRDIADVAYYAFLLLRDVAHQTTLQAFRNTYQQNALRADEVERLVRDFGRIVTSLPGNKGVVEMMTEDVKDVVRFITQPIDDLTASAPDPAAVERVLNEAQVIHRPVLPQPRGPQMPLVLPDPPRNE